MKDVLKNYFGHAQFREHQENIIGSVLKGKDVFVQMTTGSGKSLCYQVPALMLQGVALIVSPLIALMKDQVDALNANGINAAFINSTLEASEITEIYEDVKNGDVKLLYVAPERFKIESFGNFLDSVNISLIAIDEAHCISTWGHDFRGDYRNLRILKKMFPGVPIIALTATATSKVRDDIISQLGLDSPDAYSSSFDRANLDYYVMNKNKAFGKLVSILEECEDQSVIIYCFSRKDCERISQKLSDKNFSSLPYHAGLSKKVREINQDLFIKDKVKIMVATIAFGMGVDKPDIRLVVHYTFPKSLEGYYQEVGRAGRDGLPAKCVLFFSEIDAHKHEYFLKKMNGPEIRLSSKSKLDEMISFCQRRVCRRKALLSYFGEKYGKDNCEGCDVCLGFVEKTPKVRKAVYDTVLFAKLKRLREKVAARKGIAPFVVFGDATLQRMARIKPKTKTAMIRISGVTKHKMIDFGKEFLELIAYS